MLRILPLDQAQTFITRKAVRLAEAEHTVAPILDAVRKRGDEAVLEYARKFDGLTGSDLTIRPAEWRRESQVTPEFMAALDTAARTFASMPSFSFRRRLGSGFPTAGGWATLSGRWNRWAHTFRLAAIRCRRPF